MDRDELSRLCELENENRRLKNNIAQQVLDIVALKDLLSKNDMPSHQVSGSALPSLIHQMFQQHVRKVVDVTIRRPVTNLKDSLMMRRSSHQYAISLTVSRSMATVISHITALMQREGYRINHKHVERIW